LLPPPLPSFATPSLSLACWPHRSLTAAVSAVAAAAAVIAAAAGAVVGTGAVVVSALAVDSATAAIAVAVVAACTPTRTGVHVRPPYALFCLSRLPVSSACGISPPVPVEVD